MLRMLASICALALAASLAVPLAAVSSAPGDMSVAAFLPKAEALKKKGMMAMFSSDLKVLKAEAEGAASHYRAALAADRKAGRTPHSCPPPKGKASIGADAMMDHLRSYPASRRGSVSMKTAFADLMKKKYPCG